jgi:hypothetical protein
LRVRGDAIVVGELICEAGLDGLVPPAVQLDLERAVARVEVRASPHLVAATPVLRALAVGQQVGGWRTDARKLWPNCMFRAAGLQSADGSPRKTRASDELSSNPISSR